MRRHLSMLLMSAIAALLAGGALLGFAQNEGTTTSPMDHLHHSHSAEFAKVPETARSRMNPLVNDPDALVAGRKLFQQHCAECHGDTAEGGRRAPSLRAEEVQQASPGTLFWILTNGVVRRGMPICQRCGSGSFDHTVTFVKSLTPSAAAEPGVEHDHAH